MRSHGTRSRARTRCACSVTSRSCMRARDRLPTSRARASMDPEDYEYLVAQVLRDEGWDAHVTPYRRDFGVDVIAERDGARLGVQVKMWAGANRRIAGPEVMEVHGAAAYADCERAMIIT